MKKTFFNTVILLCAISGIPSCTTHYFRSNYNEANRLIHETNNLQVKPFLKAHMKNGDVYILSGSWTIDEKQEYLSGNGTQYDFNRRKIYNGTLTLSVDSVAIFETNTKLNNTETGRITALSILAGLDLIIGIHCLSNPKACFGSCPTFYKNPNDNFHFADAEGFSNAITPSMEYADVDALNHQRITDTGFTITMKNEALETHCVNDLKLLAYPLHSGERVYQSPANHFYLCEGIYPPAKAMAPEGEITSLLTNQDYQERFSYADENYLNSKEEIFLTFDATQHIENPGLILNFRQTLMTTYFIYSAMGYMGDEVGDLFARFETDKSTSDKLNNGLKKELGNIDVYCWNEKSRQWDYQSGFYETGPIAINKQFIPLKYTSSGRSIKIKLIINKGLWRIDFAGLTSSKKQIQPVEISPAAVLSKGKPDSASLKALQDEDKYLISMPGSEYSITFGLPESNTDYELFLSSKGYYLEWMRSHWLKDKDLMKLKQMVINPKTYLKREARNYKLYEVDMEQEFWNSKIDTKNFSYHEH